MQPTMRQSINEMFNENDRLSIARIMTFIWFMVMCVTIFVAIGKHHSMSEPIVTAVFTFEFANFTTLLTYCFVGKTKLNFKNLKDGFDLERNSDQAQQPPK